MLAFALFAVCGGTAGLAQLTPGPRPPVNLAQLEPGAIGLLPAGEPAAYGFQPAKGRVESSWDGAANAVQHVLDTPGLGHSQLAAAVGVLEFAAAPFVAAYGAINSAGQKLSTNQLAAAEKDLTAAMQTMADQQHFCQAVLRSAGERTRRRLISLKARPTAWLRGGPAAVLETQVEELVLERAGAGDGTYRLRIRARARLARRPDGAALLDRAYEYRSGEAMFIDWTRHDGFASVARTGYHELAERIAAEVFCVPSEPLIRLGAGQKTAPARRRPGAEPPTGNTGRGPELTPRSALTDPAGSPSPVAWATQTQGRHSLAKAGPVLVAAVELRGLLPAAPTNEPPAGGGSVTLYVESPAPMFHLEGARTTPEEPANPPNDADWSMDGLENHANSVVQGIACVVAVPIGLWEQTVGAVRRHFERRVDQAGARLQEVVWQTPPQQGLADELGRCLAPLMSKPLVVLSGRFAAETNNALAATPFPARGSPARDGQAPAEPGAGTQTDTALELRVTDVRLERSGGLRPRLALCVEAEAVLIRAGDGQELCIWPLQYCSSRRRLADWTESDARLFRDELARGCREMGGAIAQQLAARGFVSAKPPSALAPE